MPLAALMGLGPAELGSIFDFSPKVNPENCVLVGIRDVDDPSAVTTPMTVKVTELLPKAAADVQSAPTIAQNVPLPQVLQMAHEQDTIPLGPLCHQQPAGSPAQRAGQVTLLIVARRFHLRLMPAEGTETEGGMKNVKRRGHGVT